MASEKKKFRIPTVAEMEQVSQSSSYSIKPQETLTAFRRQEKEDSLNKTEDKNKVIQEFSQMKKSSFLTSTDSSEMVSGSKSSSFSNVEDQSKMSENEDTSVGISEQKEKTVSDSSSSGSGFKKDVPVLSTKGGKSNSLIVNSRQRGNPILKFVRNIPWEFGEIVPDYVMGLSTCALYLSLRYHQLNPNYIHERLKQLGRAYDLRVMLVQVDIKEPHHLLKELSKICILADCTLMLAFTPEEAGRYLETYKVYEFKPADPIMEKTDHDFVSKFTDCLTSVKSVNKTDAMILMSTFKTMEGIMEASKEDLSLCPGFGPQKAQRVFDIFQEPFLKSKKQKSE